jgi:hypothetical protein
VAAPGVAAPHDPPPELTDRPPLAPPDTTVWGPAQRRLGADEIALQWAAWRSQIDDLSARPEENAAAADSGTAGEGSPPEENTGDGGTGQGDAGAGARADEGQGAPGSRSGKIRRVLAEARAYVDDPPPLGRVRSSFASDNARTLRADGPGWSLVARTDDMAFLLLDDEPGEILPVGRGPELPGLLEALDRMAVRPN